ncbi:hypothetical protein [Niveispirillum cyanobacteriorum]|uniref:Uncharacterized protein n=1 Tax=Niveispirillum cyanobacteriorum TaxID=1612173 RepID=A0A2K9NFR9_9PROT|nr:hypothetical protein [Niveispirillum cyanobacteriorum]AUN31951.1 hypothetical protein C0V82_16100 [Niveispirillum cyanobacteriorum]GGE85486.1 hypothetical protein GCM10011317_48350 [Niveispirillum cyanobacteriorum]
MITVITPAVSARLATVDALKAELGIDGGASDQALGDLIDQVSSAVAGWCRRSFGAETVRQTEWLRSAQGEIILARAAEQSMPLTIVSVAVDGSALTVDDYILEGGMLLRLCNGRPVLWRAGKVDAVYTAGYNLPEDGSPNLPAAVQRACLDLCVARWTGKGQDPNLRSRQIDGVGEDTWFDPDKRQVTEGMPDQTAAALRPYQRWIIA